MGASPGSLRTRAASVSALELQRTALLRCPRCDGPAWSRIIGAASPAMFSPRRVTCAGCGYTAVWREQTIHRADGVAAVDDYFHLPILLQTPCCGDVLWAYNPAHLDALGEWLRADLRERRRDPHQGWSNQGFWSRLPQWIKQSKHRDDVAAALRRLDAMAVPFR